MSMCHKQLITVQLRRYSFIVSASYTTLYHAEYAKIQAKTLFFLHAKPMCAIYLTKAPPLAFDFDML